MSFGSANEQEAVYWNADAAQHWITHEDRYERMFGALGEHALRAAEITPTDHILDIGCGTGSTTLAAARRASQGDALGIDISAQMTDRCRQRAREMGIKNVRFETADVQTHDFGAAQFDSIISRFGVMFFDDPLKAFKNVGHAMCSGGRLAFVCWQDVLANEWMTIPGSAAAAQVRPADFSHPTASGVFAFADRDWVAQTLGLAGFVDVEISGVRDTLVLAGGASLDETVDFLRGADVARVLFAEAEPEAIERAMKAVRDALRPHETMEGICLGAAVWVVTARRP